MVNLRQCRCGVWFRPSSNRRGYCSDECRREAELESKRRYMAGLAAAEKRRARSGVLVIRPRPDLAAAEEFASRQHGRGRHPGPGVVGSTPICDRLG